MTNQVKPALSSFYIAKLDALCSVFNQAGGMQVETPQALEAYEHLVDAVEYASCHESALKIVDTRVHGFYY